MFTWICPKCGKEVPPAYSDCPNCSTQDQSVSEPAATYATPVVPSRAPDTAPPPQGRRVPAWLVSLIFAAVLVGGGAAFLHFRSRTDISATQPASPPSASLEDPSAQAPATPPSDLVVKNLELTGLRLTEDANQKTFLQVVVVNHSGADLGEVHAQLNLKAVTTGKDLAPVGACVIKTTLGPYESKELKVPVQTKLRAYEFPDWQFLRAEIIGQ